MRHAVLAARRGRLSGGTPADRGRPLSILARVTASIVSVNIGRSRPLDVGRNYPDTSGIGKEPQAGAVGIRPPGPRRGGLGSGLVGDFIGDSRHHGGDEQAVYAVGQEDLDHWSRHLDRELTPGMFGENLTTAGIDVNEALLGERWRVGDGAELVVTGPRIPCRTFQVWLGVRGWVKTYTAAGRPGAYLRVAAAGQVRAGDAITVLRRPDHDVTVAMAFRAMTTERELIPHLATAEPHLSDELRTVLAKAG